MPRRPNLDRPTSLATSIPESLRGRLDLHLFSEVEGRVPHGAYQELILRLLREFFDWRTFEVAPGLFVKGPPEAIEILERSRT